MNVSVLVLHLYRQPYTRSGIRQESSSVDAGCNRLATVLRFLCGVRVCDGFVMVCAGVPVLVCAYGCVCVFYRVQLVQCET